MEMNTVVEFLLPKKKCIMYESANGMSTFCEDIIVFLKVFASF